MCQGTADFITLTENTTLVGEFRSSGYREPPGLVARGDGQMVRLPQLLYRIARLIDEFSGEQTDLLRVVAEQATQESGLDLTAEHVEFLVDHKLAPLGVTTYHDGSAAPLATSSPLLSLRVRMPLLRERGTWRVAGLFGWLYRPPVLIVLVLAALAAEAWVLGTHSAAAALRFTLQQPASIVLVVVLAIASTAFHECGHATACRYSGARPGVMGCGIYLVWPAFYTDITDSYRLDRIGRLRTDLGGVYFNGLFLLAVAGTYLATGYPPLLVAVLSINIEVIQQLLPTLRFDGYYIVADLVGVPDLFRYIGPILRRTVLRRPAEPQLGLLKRWPQLVVTAWVLLIVPALAAQLGYLVLQLPGLVRADWRTIDSLIRQAAAGNPVLGVITTTLRVLLLLLPVAGAVVILVQLVRMALRAVLRRQRVPRRVAIAGAGAAAAVLVGGIAVALVPATRPLPTSAPRDPARTAPSTTYETPATSTADPSTTDAPTTPRHTPAVVPSGVPVATRRATTVIRTTERTAPVPVPPTRPANSSPSSAGTDCELLGLPLPSLLCQL